QLVELAFLERTEGFFLGVIEWGIEFGEELETVLGDAAEDLPAIGQAALAQDELLGLQPVDQPRDAGRLLDEPLDDLERRQPLFARAAENAQDVVLLRRDVVGLDDGADVAADEVR